MLDCLLHWALDLCGFACITGPLILISNHTRLSFGVAMVAATVTLSPEV